MMISTILFHLSMVFSIRAKLYWTLDTDPVVLGRDVKLLCKTSAIDHDCRICLTGWHGGSENSIISISNYTVNMDKYFVSYDDRGFSLTIRNFSLGDANKDYECTQGFQSYKTTLVINKSSLSYLNDIGSTSGSEYMREGGPPTSNPELTTIMDVQVNDDTKLNKKQRYHSNNGRWRKASDLIICISLTFTMSLNKMLMDST